MPDLFGSAHTGSTGSRRPLTSKTGRLTLQTAALTLSLDYCSAFRTAHADSQTDTGTAV